MSNLLLFGARAVALADATVSLAATNVEAIGKDGAAVTNGGLDRWGDAYSSALLGTTATWAGVTFTFGGALELDAASGATVDLPAGSYTKLSMLASAANGNQAKQTFVVTYTDGTSSSFTQSISDWFTPQSYAGESKAATEAYRLDPSGAMETGPFYVYGYSFAINSTKIVKSITLPRNRNVVVLALSLTPSGATPVTGTAATSVNVALTANVEGIGKNGAAVTHGGLDEFGDAYSSTLLGSKPTWGGVTFSLEGAGALDAASGSTLGLPAGRYSKLSMLASAVNGDQTNQTFVVTYTDGTTSTLKQSISDWFTPQNYAGESKALTQAYRLDSSGQIATGPFYVYGYSFAINSAKTVKSITLPRNRNVVVLALSLTPSGAATSTGTTTGTGTSTGTGTGTTPVVSLPAAPTNLAAKAGNAQVTLTWTAGSGATSYDVKRATSSGGPYTQVEAPTATSDIDASLTNGTTYYYVVSAINSAGQSANSAQVSARPAAPAVVTPPVVTTPPPITTSTSTSSTSSNACGMQLGDTPVTFCYTFDAPAATAGVRTGQLDTNVWAVSRSQDTNFGQQWYNLWNPTPIIKCDGTTPTVLPPNDIIICNGQLREATNDNNSGAFDAGDVTSLAMYPKQPFDFSGRTGTVSFDVSNDGGPHGAWPEFWMSDLPVPDPFNHFAAWQSLPANGLGIRFDAYLSIGTQGFCQSTDTSKLRWGVESASAVRNYILDDTLGFGTPSSMKVTDLDCVVSSSGPGDFNHIELRISQGQVDVYATDAGVAASPATLKHIAVISNTNYSFTRGLVWLEDVHYNGDKILDLTRPSESKHTFSWDNLAFDGAFIGRDFGYDAPDNNLSVSYGGVSLGKFSTPNQNTSWSISGIPANPNPSAVRVVFNFNGGSGILPTVINLIVNGHAHSIPWPYPDTDTATTRTLAMTIPVSDLVAGTNVVQIGTDQYEAVFNVSLILAGVPGGVPVLPGSNNAYPGS